MRRLLVAVSLLTAVTLLAQQASEVEITSEPSHHLVLENQYVRVFDVIVAPKATTLVHRHNHDYLFVTLGDSDVVSARTDAKPVELVLKDGETRFSAGKFAHSAINKLDRPFHNETIELLGDSTNVKPCTENCTTQVPCSFKAACPTLLKQVSSDQWTASLVTVPSRSGLPMHTHKTPHLVVAVSDVHLIQEFPDGTSRETSMKPGDRAWVSAGVTHALRNEQSEPARFVALEFNEKN